MSFTFSELHTEEFNTRGATVFRGVLPPSLVRDLRRATDIARDIARAIHPDGAQAQRLMPVADTGIDMRPFEDYRDLEPLREAIGNVISPEHGQGALDIIAVLVEPAGMPYCTAWHRDGRNVLSEEEYNATVIPDRNGAQANCALYEDFSLWFVPGSDSRPDLPHEKSVRPIHPEEPDLSGLGYEERERFCIDYATAMPDAECLHLHAGDFALYRACAWHLGSYLPHVRRTTLHEPIFSPRTRAWWNEHILPGNSGWKSSPESAARVEEFRSRHCQERVPA